MATWEKIDAQDLIDPALREMIQKVQEILAPIQVVLELLQIVLETIKVFLLALANPLLAVAQALMAEIEAYLKNLLATGLYVLYDMPRTQDAWDPATFIKTYAGGASEFYSRVTAAFYDPYDMNKPAFANTAYVGGVMFALEEEDLMLWWKLICDFKHLFTDKQASVTMPAPSSVSVTPGNAKGEIKKGVITVRFKDEWHQIAAPKYSVEYTSVSAANRQKFVETKSTDPKAKVALVPAFDDKGQPIMDDSYFTAFKPILWNAVSPYYEAEFTITDKKLLGKPIYVRLVPINTFALAKDPKGLISADYSVVVPFQDLEPATDVRIDGGTGKFKIEQNNNVLRLGTWMESEGFVSKLTTAYLGGPPQATGKFANYVHNKTTYEAFGFCPGTYTPAQIADEWNTKAPAAKTIGATVESGRIVFYVRKPYPNQVMAVNTSGLSSAHTVLGLANTGSYVRDNKVLPDWERISVQDIFPFLIQIVQRLVDFLNSMVEGFRSAVDAVIDFISLIQMKITQIQTLIDDLNAILDFMQNLFVGTFYQLIVDPVTGGQRGFISEFESATNGPSSGEAGLVSSILLLVGADAEADAQNQMTALKAIFGIV